MSRLLDHLKNAERKRRDLRERRSGTSNSTAGPPDKPRRTAKAAPSGAKKAAAKAGFAEDELYLAEAEKARHRAALEQAALEEIATRRQEIVRADEAAAQRLQAEQVAKAAADAKLAAEREAENAARARAEQEAQ